MGWDGSTSEKSDSDCEKIAQNFYQGPGIIFRHGPNLSLNPSHIITVNNPQSLEITILFTMRFLFLSDWQIWRRWRTKPRALRSHFAIDQSEASILTFVQSEVTFCNRWDKWLRGLSSIIHMSGPVSLPETPGRGYYQVSAAIIPGSRSLLYWVWWASWLNQWTHNVHNHAISLDCLNLKWYCFVAFVQVNK